jgi:hypothetical protein
VDVSRAVQVLEMGVATGVAALTITRAKPLRPIRDWIYLRSLWWGELASCPYCMAHWVGAIFVVWQMALDHAWGARQAFQGVLTWLMVVAIASVVAKSIYLAIITILPPQSENNSYEREIINAGK